MYKSVSFILLSESADELPFDQEFKYTILKTTLNKEKEGYQSEPR